MRKSALTPRMEAEIALAEAGKAYRDVDSKLYDLRQAKVHAAETFCDAERNLAKVSAMYDQAYALEQDVAHKLKEAQDEYLRLETEFADSVKAKLLGEDEP